MKSWMFAGAGMVLLAAAGAAVAQSTPPAPPADAPRADQAQTRIPERMGERVGDHGGDRMHEHRREHGHHRGWRHPMPPPPPSEAAFFRIRKGDTSVMIRCAEDEPMKACVEAGSALLDKVAGPK